MKNKKTALFFGLINDIYLVPRYGLLSNGCWDQDDLSYCSHVGNPTGPNFFAFALNYFEVPLKIKSMTIKDGYTREKVNFLYRYVNFLFGLIL